MRSTFWLVKQLVTQVRSRGTLGEPGGNSPSCNPESGPKDRPFDVRTPYHSLQPSNCKPRRRFSSINPSLSIVALDLLPSRLPRLKGKMLTDGCSPHPHRSRPFPPRLRLHPFRLVVDTDSIPPNSRFYPSHGHRSFLSQTGRHRQPNTPYAKPLNDRNDGPSRRGRPAPESSNLLVARLGQSNLPVNPNSRRNPIGMPKPPRPISPERWEAQKAAHSKLNEKMRSEDMKTWLRSRVLQDGVMNMSVGLRVQQGSI